MTNFVIGALAAGLVIAVAGLVVQYFANRRSLRLVLAQETRALDAARAAELRASQQIDAMLERIATQPRLELSAAAKASAVDPDATKYITDEPYMDEAWNDYRNATDEDESE